MNKHYNKIHFETMVDISTKIVETMYGKHGAFYEVINEIEDQIYELTGTHKFKAFIHDTACQIYMDDMFKKVYGTSIYNEDTKYVRAGFWEIYLPYLFSRYGKKVFRLSKNLVHMLSNTDLKKVDSFFIELPYKCLYLSIPKELKLLNTFDLPIDGFYIALLKNDEVNYAELSSKYQRFQHVEEAKSLIIVAVSDVLLSKNDPRDSLYYWHVIFEKGDILSQLKNYISQWLENTELAKKNITKDFIFNIFSFIINTILYINSYDKPLVEKKIKVSNVRQPKNKKKKKKAQQRTNLPYYSLGSDIVIDHNFQKIINLTERNETKHQKHITKWMVRGHWRNQAVGTGRSKRKLIWIQPYVKGEEFSEIINKEYKVK